MKNAYLSMLSALLLSACVTARPSPDQACYYRHEAEEKDIGYCAVRRSGNMLYFSGTDAPAPMPAAIRAVYGRLQKSLGEHGLTFADVVKETVYTTDLDAFTANAGLRKPFYGGSYPAATWVQVQRLYDPSYVLEVELIARIPETRVKDPSISH